MTILFMDGFDHYYGTDITKKWSISSAPSSGISPAYACPPGGQGITFGVNQLLTKYFSSAYGVGCIGFNFKTPTASFTNSNIFQFLDSDGLEQCSIRTDGSHKLIISRAGTTLATSTNQLSTDTWYHIECKIKIHNTAGQYELRVNGSSSGWIPQSSADKNTRARTNNSFSGINFTGMGNSPYFDDIYVLNCDSTPNDDFLGPQKILTLTPKKTGYYSQWSSNYMTNFMNLRDTVADTVTFNYTSTANNIDTFGFGGLPQSTIAGIQHVIFAKHDGGARSIAPVIRKSSTDYVGSTMALTSSWLFYCDQDDVDPATSSAFVYSDIVNMEFGYKLIS